MSAMTLADFLLLRIAEDEAVARQCLSTEAGRWSARVEIPPAVWTVDGLSLGYVTEDYSSFTPGAAQHVARHDPAHVLADCEAKRRIVAEHESYDGYGESCRTCHGEDDLAGDPWPCATLRALAMPYADRRDYDESWRPVSELRTRPTTSGHTLVMPETPAAPGWYPAPDMAASLRYWDGADWTDKVAPAPVEKPVDHTGLLAAGWICVFLVPPAAIVLGVMLDKRGHPRQSAVITALGLVFTLIVGLVIWSASRTPVYY